MVLRHFARRRSLGQCFKIALFLCFVLVIYSISNVPRKLSQSLEGQHRKGTNRPENRGLPDFSNGGIIVFYHIYKTGGSTVGKLFHEMSRRDEAQHSTNNAHLKAKATYEYTMTSPSKLFFTMIRKQVDWERDCLTTLGLAQKKKKLILLELHVEHPAPNFPSLVELAPTLDRWRAEADRRGVEFFAFTLLREPVAHALSFFNFFHVGSNKVRATPTRKDHDYWNPFKPLPLSEKNLLHSYYANDRQCRMLNSDPEATFAAPRDLVWDDRRLFSQEEIAS